MYSGIPVFLKPRILGKLFQLGTTSSLHLPWNFRFFQRRTLSLVNGLSTDTGKKGASLCDVQSVQSIHVYQQNCFPFHPQFHPFICNFLHQNPQYIHKEWPHLSDLSFSQQWPPILFYSWTTKPKFQQVPTGQFFPGCLWVLAVMINMLHHWTSQGTGNLLYEGRIVNRIPFTKS